MTLILALIFLPVVIGYYIGTARYFRDKTGMTWWELEILLKRLLLYISRLPELYKQWHYKYVRLPKLIQKTREGDNQALAERLTHTDRGMGISGRDIFGREIR